MINCVYNNLIYSRIVNSYNSWALENNSHVITQLPLTIIWMFLSSQGNSQPHLGYAMVYECPYYYGVIIHIPSFLICSHYKVKSHELVSMLTRYQ